MRFLAAVALTSAVACATTSSASSGQNASAQACSASEVPAVVSPSAEVYARPDGNSQLVGSVDGGTRVCVDPTPSGYGFRRVRLPDGKEGYVDDKHVNLL
jgi:hypothetical protein